MSKRINRRQLLKAVGGSAAFSYPIQRVLACIASGAITKAMAAQAGQPLSPYVAVGIWGGLSGFTFVPYEPGGQGRIVPHADTVNYFNGSAYSFAQVNQTVSLPGIGNRTINAPPLWGTTIPRPGGGSVPMKEMLKNFFCLNGVDMRGPDHGFCSAATQAPTAGGYSLTGMAAAQSSRLFPAVAGYSSGEMTYRSPNGASLTLLPTYASNYVPGVPPTSSTYTPLTQLMHPFNNAGLPASFDDRFGALKGHIDQAMSAIDMWIGDRRPGSEALAEDRNRAEERLQAGVGDLLQEYYDLYTKYADLIEQSKGLVNIGGGKKGSSIPGFSPAPIPGSTTPGAGPQRLYKANKNDHIFENADMRGIIDEETELTQIAASYAIAEYLLKNQLTSVCTVGNHSSLAKINYEGLNGDADYVWSLDEHVGGSIPSAIICAWIFRANMACIHELQSVLNSHPNTASETPLIQLVTEFLRNQHNYGGSDHAYTANSYMAWSKKIKEPTILGNIKRYYEGQSNPSLTGYFGSWDGAPVIIGPELKRLNCENAASTLAVLGGFQTPATNAMSVLTPTANGVIAAIPQGLVVD